MPEICEVTLTSEILKKRINHKYLTDVIILSGRYTKSQPEGYSHLIKLLKGGPLKILDVESRGKFMWFELMDKNEHGVYIWNTFGLTGMWGFEPKKNSRIEFVLKDGEKFYYTDDRNFGTIKFDFDKQNLIKKLKTFPVDYLKDDITEEEFKKRLKKIKDPNKLIVEILMDQKKLGSGLGNYLVPEILYRAKISPYQEIGFMTDAQIHELFKAIKHVVKLCYVNNTTGYMKYLEKYLPDLPRKNYLPNTHIGHEKFKFLVYMQDKDPHGNEVMRDQIIDGRSTYWVPAVQKIVKKKTKIV